MDNICLPILAAVILLACVSFAYADITLVDGQEHIVDYYLNPNGTLHISGYIRADEPWRETIVELLDNGFIDGNVSVGSVARFTMLGGSSDNADIILVPEPATVFLVGLGVVMLRRKS